MKNIYFLLIIIFTSIGANAQFIKEKAISAQIGYGLSSPYNSNDNIINQGFFIQGEYILKVASWAELKPYLGFVSTSSDGTDIDDNPTNEKATTKALLLGGKARLRAPIKWVAPYFEIGIGTSIGKFETFTSFDTIEKSGLIYHIPLAFGLEIGRNNNFDLGFLYFIQPTVQQYAGAFAVGVSFPLN